MNKYKVIMSGLGAEVFVHDITPEQKQTLQEWGVDSDNPESDIDLEELTELLEKDSWDYSDETYTGPYTSKCNIRVFDEDENLVWKSDEEFEMDMNEDTFIEKENILVIEHYVKGGFKDYTLEIEGEFNPEKLSYNLADVHEYVEVITDLVYDGKVIDLDEHGDYWSKGCFFYLF